MSWIDGEVDGVPVKIRSIIGTAEWNKSFERIMEYEAEGLADRENMAVGFGDSFADSDDVSMTNGSWELGCLKPIITPAILGDDVMPEMHANSQSDYVISIEQGQEDTPLYNLFDNNSTGSYWYQSVPNGSPFPNINIQLPQNTEIGGYTMYAGGGTYDFRRPKSWSFQGSNDGTSWITLDNQSNQCPYTDLTKYYYALSSPANYKYYRFYNIYSWSASPADLWIYEIELSEVGSLAYTNPAIMMLSSYELDVDIEAVKVKVWLEDLSNSGAITCGDAAADLVQAQLSYDGNVTSSAPLSFSSDPQPNHEDSNIYIFTSDEVDVSGETITGLGLNIQSFDRGEGAPNFKFHGALVVGRESVK